jgi:hypothetical protein
VWIQPVVFYTVVSVPEITKVEAPTRLKNSLSSKPSLDFHSEIILPAPRVTAKAPSDDSPGRHGRAQRDILLVHLMNSANFQEISGFLWSIAKSVLPDEVKRGKYPEVIPPFAPREGIDRHWLLSDLYSNPVFAGRESGVNDATIRGINIRDFKRAQIPVPPPDEQQKIARHLSRQFNRLNSVRGLGEEQITRLEQYRSALIATAATGQIDISGLGN